MGNKRISLICYADDAALFAESEDDLQRQLLKFYQACRQVNLSISAKKTKSITIAKDPIRCKLIVEDKSIEQLAQFKYLD